MQQKKHKRKITARFIGIITTLVLLSTLVLFFVLVRLAVLYLHSRNEYHDIVQNAVSVHTPEPSTSGTTSEPNANTSNEVSTPTPIVSEVPITVDWDELHDANKNIVGWLYCEDTDIQYPVVQATNNTYYLTHNVNKKEDQAGALFLDYRNEPGKKLQNLIIYGHRMKDGSMFGNLVKFSERSYRNNHQVFYFLTEDQSYKINVFACRTIRSESKYFPTSFASEAAMKTYYNKALTQSYWQGVPEVWPEDAVLITLSTCSKYDFADDPKLLVQGWAIPVD